MESGREENSNSSIILNIDDRILDLINKSGEGVFRIEGQHIVIEGTNLSEDPRMELSEVFTMIVLHNMKFYDVLEDVKQIAAWPQANT